ncbi:Fanconi anemia group E protein, partial [Eurypyga helias]
PWLQSLDKPCRLLLHALASGPSGTLAALRMLQRVEALEGPGQAFPWQSLTAALCAQEPALEGPEGALAVRHPRLLLLPVVCQRNLFSLLLVVQAAIPEGCLSRLLQATEQCSHPDAWMRMLGDLLRQGLMREGHSPAPVPMSAACQQQLGRRGAAADAVPQGGKRKKVSEESLESDEEREGRSPLLEEAAFDPPGTQEHGDTAGVEEEVPVETSGGRSTQSPAGTALESAPQDAAEELRETSQAELAAEVQSFLQHSALSIPPELHILNKCSPSQLEGLCSFLQLSTCPEQLLGRFCSWLLALTPDLSYTSAAVLAEQLFLRRVLSLARPPSRHLMAALASFCSKYSQPFCRVLLAAVMREPGEGAEQTKLVCELVEECLEPDSVILVLSQVLEVPLSEKLLPVVQAVLGRQEVIPPELFDLLVLTLCRHAPAFAMSQNYAKLVMAVLTTYQSQVTPGHRSCLAAALDHSKAALRKSLQAVL